MISPHQQITKADLDALATLANTKLAPATPFKFTAFAGKDQILLPSDITVTPTYGGTGSFPDGSKVTIWLFGYKTIAGEKTYSWTPTVKAFQSTPGFGQFSLTWEWTATSGATESEGYLVVIPQPDAGGWIYFWRDIANILTLTEDGTFTAPGWVVDEKLEQDFGGTTNDLPCAHGTWLKMLNTIRQRLCLMTDIGCQNSGDVTGLETIGGFADATTIQTLGIAALTSGPWCVAACGSGDNILTAWIARVAMYVQGATHGFTICFTQCYRAIEFYFRNADAPGGVNITAENKLTAFTIGSALVTADPAHYHLRIVSCSDGHIKVQDSGGGTVRVDMDVTAAGAPYDLSFDVAGVVINGLSLPLNIDATFTTATATVDIAAAGIELNNDVRKCTVPDSYCELEFNNPVQNNVGGLTTVQLCTTCLQLVLTENNKTAGVWKAMTLPTFGQMTYLDVDLPQYGPQTSAPASSRRVARTSI